MSAACTRYPCSRAYRGQAHGPNGDGDVLHAASVGSHMHDGGYSWRVDVTAWNDSEPWTVDLEVGSGRLVLHDPDEAIRLSSDIAQAVVWAMKANQRETEQAP